MAISAQPHEIQHGIVIPLLLESGFQFKTDESNQYRFKTSFVWNRLHVEKDPASEFYGQTRTLKIDVEIVAFSLSASLILHGIVRKPQAESHERTSLQIQCSQSLDDIRKQVKSSFVAKVIQLASVRIDELPVELKLNILANLPVESMMAMSRVSTEWMHLTEDEQLWKSMVKKHYPALVDAHLSDQTWKSQFKAEYIRRQNARRPPQFPDYPVFRPMPPFMPPWTVGPRAWTPLEPNSFLDPFDPMGDVLPPPAVRHLPPDPMYALHPFQPFYL